MMTMKNGEASSIQTRPSLLNQLKVGDDDSWREFYRVYGRIVRDFAIQAGLTDAEADEVMQETAIGVARHLPEFRYNPNVCRFKTWLLNQTSWRIKDQIKKRRRTERFMGPPSPAGDETGRTATIERLPESEPLNLEGLFEAEWRKNLLTAALERVRMNYTLKQFQIFDLHALNEWPAMVVARSLGVRLANVYVTKHRVAAALKKEIARLEPEMDRTLAAKVAALPETKAKRPR